MDPAEEADYVIVGAGSAGSALAGLLSRDARRRVLLLEAGGSDRRFWIRTPIGYGKTFHDTSVNWCYRTEPDPGLDGRAAFWPRGKVLGGSSSINAMVYLRGLPQDFDDWRDAGNPGWGWADVAPVFERIERRAGPAGLRGDGALWVAEREAEYHPIRRHFYAAAAELGLPRSADLNGQEPEGVGAYAITTRGGWRQSAADAFLRPALGRANLRVLTGALAERIVLEDRRAVGVVARTPGGRRLFRARAAVILAAGAVNSPQLLQLSGIGPGAVLAAAGIPVLHDNPAVGGGLQDHLGISYFYRAREATLNQVLGTWPGRLAAGLRFLLTRSGPLSLSVNQAGGLVRSRPDCAAPDMQLYFNPLSYTIKAGGRRELLKPDRFPGFIMGFNPCRPTSTGRIDIASPDPATPPRIRSNALATEADIAGAIAGARLCGRLQETAALRRLIEAVTVFDPARATDEAILADYRARASTVYHPCGTCRMAPAAAGGVVDAALRVHGIEGLRVADASAFPNITSGNTNAPTIMLAHKAAEAIAAS